MEGAVMPGALEIPGPALSDPEATEIARVWVAHQGQHVSLRVGLWKEPESWGIVLADLVQHIANAYVQENHLDREHVVASIFKLIQAELARPTDTPIGRVTPPEQ
jgi:uncharacterized protein (DUF2267 family)